MMVYGGPLIVEQKSVTAPRIPVHNELLASPQMKCSPTDPCDSGVWPEDAFEGITIDSSAQPVVQNAPSPLPQSASL